MNSPAATSSVAWPAIRRSRARRSKWIDDWLGWIPLLNSRGAYGNSYFLAGIVLAIMVLPIVASLSREVFLQVPRENEEAALALGATRWEMIRLASFPYARPGIVAGRGDIQAYR